MDATHAQPENLQQSLFLEQHRVVHAIRAIFPLRGLLCVIVVVLDFITRSQNKALANLARLVNFPSAQLPIVQSALQDTTNRVLADPCAISVQLELQFRLKARRSAIFANLENLLRHLAFPNASLAHLALIFQQVVEHPVLIASLGHFKMDRQQQNAKVVSEAIMQPCTDQQSARRQTLDITHHRSALTPISAYLETLQINLLKSHAKCVFLANFR